jgi:hypothetical protein
MGEKWLRQLFDSITIECSRVGFRRLQALFKNPNLAQRQGILQTIKHITIRVPSIADLKGMLEPDTPDLRSASLAVYVNMRNTLLNALGRLPNLELITITKETVLAVVSSLQKHVLLNLVIDFKQVCQKHHPLAFIIGYIVTHLAPPGPRPESKNLQQQMFSVEKFRREDVLVQHLNALELINGADIRGLTQWQTDLGIATLPSRSLGSLAFTHMGCPWFLHRTNFSPMFRHITCTSITGGHSLEAANQENDLRMRPLRTIVLSSCYARRRDWPHYLAQFGERTSFDHDLAHDSAILWCLGKRFCFFRRRLEDVIFVAWTGLV